MFGCGRSGIIILAAVIAVAFIVVAILGFGSINPYYGYGGYYGGMMGGFGGLGMLFMVPVVLLVIAVVGYFLWRGCDGWGNGGGGGCCGGDHYTGYQNRDDALAILRQRYARGEISREQFEQMRQDINSQ